MKNRFLILLFSIGIIHSHGQILPNTKVINTINTTTKPVYIFGKYKKSEFINVDYSFNAHTQAILKSDSGLYVFIDGTGQLYKLQYINSSPSFERIDSTNIWGYNIGSFPFTYKNKIYNLGGSGLWRGNGHLRVFNTKAHEWDIVPVNDEVQLISGFREGIISYDQLNGKIYSAYYNKNNDGIKGKREELVFKVMVLDLTTNDWSCLGNLNSELISGIKNNVNLTITSMGLITSNGLNINLWDFPNNQLYELRSHKDYFQSIVRGFDSTLVFYKNGYLYQSRGGSLDSENITIKDFIPVGTIYAKSLKTKLDQFFPIIYILIVGLSLALLLWGVKKYKNNLIQETISKFKKELEITSQKHIIFTEQEKLLLNILIENSSNNIRTTIEQINKTQGLESRPIETQKSQRHKLISSINAKYSSIGGNKIIQSEKLEFDRRSNVYFIEKEDLVMIKTFVN